MPYISRGSIRAAAWHRTRRPTRAAARKDAPGTETALSLGAPADPDVETSRQLSGDAAARAQDANEALLALAFDHISEGVCLHDFNGAVLAVNAPFLDTFGMSRQEALASRFPDDLCAPRGDAARRTWGAPKPGDTTVVRWNARRGDGSTFDATATLRAIEQNGRTVLVALVTKVFEPLTVTMVKQVALRQYHERRQTTQRELIARDLHDGLGGIIANIGIMVGLAQKNVQCKGKGDCYLSQIGELALEGSTEIRGLMSTLDAEDAHWPDLLGEMRRFGAMLLGQHPIAFSLTVTGDPPTNAMDLFAGLSVFRMFKEAITNVARHSGATRVDVSLAFGADDLEWVIRDDGKGLPVDFRPGRGLRNMALRAQELGGELRVTGGSGLTLAFSLPISDSTNPTTALERA